MDDLSKIVFTSSLTVVGGVLVFVMGQFLSKFVLEPLQDFKTLLDDIRHSLIFYDWEIYTPISGDKEGRRLG